MTSQFINDKKGLQCGRLDDHGHVVYAYDRNGRMIGSYVEVSNVTLSSTGGRYGTGNLLIGLIMESVTY